MRFLKTIVLSLVIILLPVLAVAAIAAGPATVVVSTDSLLWNSAYPLMTNCDVMSGAIAKYGGQIAFNQAQTHMANPAPILCFEPLLVANVTKRALKANSAAGTVVARNTAYLMHASSVVADNTRWKKTKTPSFLVGSGSKAYAMDNYQIPNAS